MILNTYLNLLNCCLIFDEGIVWMFTLLCGFGTIITGFILLRMGLFVTEKNEPAPTNISSPDTSAGEALKGAKVNLVLFTVKSPAKLNQSISRMPERSLMLLIKWLRLDYWFMLFLYPFLSLLMLQLFCSNDCKIMGFHFTCLVLLPLLTGLMDFFENLFAIRVITGRLKPGIGKARMMRLFSFLKWIGVVLIIAAFVFLFCNCR